MKLKQLHTELKVHDKETMSLKKLKADGIDKEGLKEAKIRKRFNSIMFSYGLAKSTDTKLDQSKVKVIFRLWGFKSPKTFFFFLGFYISFFVALSHFVVFCCLFVLFKLDQMYTKFVF